MIAACPRCAARYRIAREKLGGEGVRLRCAKCDAVFRVRAPEERPTAAPAPQGAPSGARPVAAAGAPASAAAEGAEKASGSPVRSAAAAAGRAGTPDAPADDAPCVLVALPSEDLAKETVECLRSRGLRTAVVHDGVEAMLEIQRQRPRAVVLSATLPRMFGFQVCEVVKRNESLGSTFVVLAGAIHDKDRYRRPPGELYGADAYLEEPDLPEALLPLLEREGLPLRPAAPGREASPPAAHETSAPAPAGPDREGSPVASPSAEGPSAGASGMAAPAAAPPVPAADDGLGEERARAERLARIIVSDIVLYNEDRFAAAVSAGNVVEVLGPDLEEGRAHFRERVDERVRGERDHLVDELVRVARARGME